MKKLTNFKCFYCDYFTVICVHSAQGNKWRKKEQILLLDSFLKKSYYLSGFGYSLYHISSVIIIIIIIKTDWQCKAGKGRLTPYQSEDPSPTLPTYRGKEEKGKIVEDKKGESN